MCLWLLDNNRQAGVAFRVVGRGKEARGGLQFGRPTGEVLMTVDCKFWSNLNTLQQRKRNNKSSIRLKYCSSQQDLPSDIIIEKDSNTYYLLSWPLLYCMNDGCIQ